MKKGKVIVEKEDKVLLVSDNCYFIVKENGKLGEEVEFDEKKALAMPSYLFAIAAIEDSDLDNTMKFIQSEWFKK